MKFSRPTTSERVTIPVRLRKKYGLYPGRKVKFELDEDGVRKIPIVTPEQIETNIGFLGTKGKLLKALMKEKSKNRFTRLNDGL